MWNGGVRVKLYTASDRVGSDGPRIKRHRVRTQSSTPRSSSTERSYHGWSGVA